MLGNSWRIGPDDTNWDGVLKNIDIMNGLQNYAGGSDSPISRRELRRYVRALRGSPQRYGWPC